jgi:hypothetical protein
LLCLGFLMFTAIIIHSCKKDNKNQLQDADITDPNVLVAQAWYNTSYPASAAASTGTTQATQSTGAQQASADWSKIISPYWSKAIAFTSKKGLNIVEAPALKKSDMAFARNMPANLSKYDFSQSGSLTSMLILKQGKQHAAYAMTILGDSSYIKGDYSKLANNTYRKKDKDFTGWVLYHQLNGTFVNGWRYVNGKVTAAAHYNPGTATSTQAVQSVSTPQVNVLQTCDITIVWEIFSLCSYANSDVTLSSPQDCTYTARFVGAYSTCSDVPATDPSGGTQTAPAPPTPPCVPQSGGSAAPAAVNSKTTLALKANKQTVLVAQPTDPPPTDPNGEIVPIPLCPVNVTTVDTIKKMPLDTLVKNKDSLTIAQRDTLNAKLNQILKDCLGQSIYNYLTTNSMSFKYTFNSTGLGDANFDPSTGNINIGSVTKLTATSLEEEFFHSIQNKQLGGILKYKGPLTGSANIEMEAKVAKDIFQYMTIFNSPGIVQGSQSVVDPNYFGWLSDISNNFTTYPSSFTPSQLALYFTFIPELVSQNPAYSTDTVNNTLNPTTLFNLVNTSHCPH